MSTNAVNNRGSSDANDNEVEILPAMPADVDKWELQSVFSSHGTSEGEGIEMPSLISASNR